MYFLLLQTPDVKLITETINTLDFSGQLILVIILLVFVICALITFQIFFTRSVTKDSANRARLDELDSTSMNTQLENLFGLLQKFIENSSEDKAIFKSAIDEFSISQKMQKEGLLEFRKYLELHDSAVAKSMENVREFNERNFNIIIELIKEGCEKNE